MEINITCPHCKKKLLNGSILFDAGYSLAIKEIEDLIYNHRKDRKGNTQAT